LAEGSAKTLIEKGEFTRAYLGVSISDMSDELSSFYGKKSGALVTAVEKDTPAEKMGLKRGDLIIALNGKEVESSSALRNLIGTMAPETEVSIKFIRDKRVYERSVKLSSAKKRSSDQGGYGYTYKGMHVEPITAQIRKAAGIDERIKGVYVGKVDSKSEAQKAGVSEGDVVIQVEYAEIDGMAAFKNAVKEGGKKRIYLYRRGGVVAVAL
jgi:serine protease Do